MTVVNVYDIRIREELRKVQRFTYFSDMEYRGGIPSKYATMGKAVSYGTGRRTNEKHRSKTRGMLGLFS